MERARPPLPGLPQKLNEPLSVLHVADFKVLQRCKAHLQSGERDQSGEETRD